MKELLICPICKCTEFRTLLSCKDFTVSDEKFTLKECSSCHFAATSPSPEIGQLPQYYKSDEYISHTSRATSLINALYLLVRYITLKSKLNLVNQYATQSEDNAILDYGCGTGEFLKVCKSSGWQITGVEPSSTARKIAQANCGNSILSSISELPKEQVYQVITLWHVLEHIPDLNDTITTLHQKLAVNGRLIVALPNRNSWDAKYYNDYWAAYDVPRHLWHFTQQNLRDLLMNHGLVIDTSKPMTFDAYYVSLLSEKYKQNNRSTFSGFFKAVVRGLQSNYYAKKNTEYSSIIYIAKK